MLAKEEVAAYLQLKYLFYTHDKSLEQKKNFPGTLESAKIVLVIFLLKNSLSFKKVPNPDLNLRSLWNDIIAQFSYHSFVHIKARFGQKIVSFVQFSMGKE